MEAPGEGRCVSACHGGCRHLQDDLIREVVSVQPRTVVVVHGPGAVLMPWADEVPAILMAFMPGQADGNAITVG